MLMSELLQAIRDSGISVTEGRVRFAIKSGKLPTPKMNAAHHFNFTPEDVDRAIRFFGIKQRAANEVAACV
ncbi:MAG: hypothetical protein JWM11_4579 [Planctomycetaceae bacterium]|nr:hypothetical protein [Planctomycetaceae bacterium]